MYGGAGLFAWLSGVMAALHCFSSFMCACLCGSCAGCRYFSVKEAYEEGLVDKLVPGYKLNRFRKMSKDAGGEEDNFFQRDKPKFKFTRQAV